jgi:hypothetical protein
MPDLKTPAALAAKLTAFGGLFTAFHAAVEPMTAFTFALVAFVVAAKA